MVLSPEKKERLRPYLEKLPESVRVMIEEHPEEMAKVLQIHKTNSEREFPSVGFVPHVGQERALRCLAKKDEKYGDYPHKIFVFGGNGSGKTCAAAAIVLAGVCLGPKFVNQKYCDWEYFYDC
jgi:DNA replication protein DnaC